MMENIKEIPYGIANFVEVAEQNMYYVDKTMYLPLLEKQPRNLFFIRPRRFGKSIFLSMLRAYYDIAQKEKFQKRFGNLWIGSRPTPLQGKFQVVYLDFSRASGGSGSLEENFNNYCDMVMDLFGKVYEPYYFPGFAQKMEEQPDFVSKLNYLNLHAAESGMKLYLIIDEYDNFTNIVLNEQGKDIYHALTHASGFYREIFKKFKGMFNVGVMVSAPLFEWGENKYKIRAAKSEAAIAKYELEEAKEKIELQVNQQSFRVKEAEKTLARARKNCESADENMKTANAGFKEGVIPTSDLLAAQTAWVSAHSEVIDAEINARLTQVYLKKSLGTLE